MQKKIYSDQQKARVALEALKGQKTFSQIISEYQVHSTQIHNWKNIAQQGLPTLFSKGDQKDKVLNEKNQLIEELYKIIGQRDTELSWLKKKLQIPD